MIMRFFENANEGKNHWLRYVAVLVISYILALIPSIIYVVGVAVKKTMSEGVMNQEQFNSLLSGQAGFVVMMLVFVFWLVFTLIFFKSFHGRECLTLISGDQRFRFNRFFAAAGCYSIFILIFAAISIVFHSDDVTFHFDATKFFVGFVLALVLAPFQTGCEEVIFRGYLMQGFGLCTKSKIWACVIITLLFGLMHSANNEVADYGFLRAMSFYMIIGLALGIFTVINDGIEFSWGIHFAHNFMGFTLFAVEGNEIGSPLFTITKDVASQSLMYSNLEVIFIAVALYFIFRRKFDWDIRRAFDSSSLKAVCNGVEH